MNDWVFYCIIAVKWLWINISSLNVTMHKCCVSSLHKKQQDVITIWLHYCMRETDCSVHTHRRAATPSSGGLYWTYVVLYSNTLEAQYKATVIPVGGYLFPTERFSSVCFGEIHKYSYTCMRLSQYCHLTQMPLHLTNPGHQQVQWWTHFSFLFIHYIRELFNMTKLFNMDATIVCSYNLASLQYGNRIII